MKRGKDSLFKVLGKLDDHMQKGKLGPHPASYTKINSKLTQNGLQTLV